jgi:dipeptidyl-peptidase-4
MIDCFQSFDTPNTYSLYTISKRKATRLESILDNNAVKQQWEAYQMAEPELLTIPNTNGQMLEAMLLRPKQTNTTGKYPLVVMHYSGPQSQRVLNRWRKRFEYALAEEGYMVLIVDTRGTDCKGRVWRNETYMNLGTKEAQDLIAAAQWAAQIPS